MSQYLQWLVNITLVTVSVGKCDIIRICVVSGDVMRSLGGHVIRLPVVTGLLGIVA